MERKSDAEPGAWLTKSTSLLVVAAVATGAVTAGTTASVVGGTLSALDVLVVAVMVLGWAVIFLMTRTRPRRRRG